MPITLPLVQGQTADTEHVLAILRQELFPLAVETLNSDTLPLQVPFFETDPVPKNQRNLTDVRTRIGLLLEYELGKAVNALLPPVVAEAVSLTYVIANKFPDLAIRTRTGTIGLRFEVKAIDVLAEEKAANFDTLLKDIRKGTDFVVVLVWKWQRHPLYPSNYPHVCSVFVFDAYDLALMRDCYWLNRPPPTLGAGRQGFDLTYAVNCRQNNYNKEEHNYGKLMRIFDRSHEQYLPPGVEDRSTLPAYYEFSREVCRRGLDSILRSAAKAYAGGNGQVTTQNAELPMSILAENQLGQRLLLTGDDQMPNIATERVRALALGANHLLVVNKKFAWRGTSTADGAADEDSGSKPASAVAWATVAARLEGAV